MDFSFSICFAFIIILFKGKSVIYFPEDSATFGEVEVKLQRKIEHPNITVRIFAMKRVSLG